MDHKPLPIGIDNFEKLVTRGWLEQKAGEALKQIEDRKYAKELEDDGYATVYRYGIAFCGKDCLVKLQQ